MIPGFHGADLIVILVIALLVFGPKRLPEMGSAIGRSIKEFRKGMNELTGPKEEPKTTTINYDAIESERVTSPIVTETPVAPAPAPVSTVETRID
jgi:sec-independent protein translocase protein TatA